MNTTQPTTPKAEVAPAAKESAIYLYTPGEAREGESCAKCGKPFTGNPPLVHFVTNPHTHLAQSVCGDCACRIGFIAPDNSYAPWWETIAGHYPVDLCKLNTEGELDYNLADDDWLEREFARRKALEQSVCKALEQSE
jgi:hypothetical protein